MNQSRHLEEVPVPDRTLAPISAWERAEFPAAPPAVQWVHPRLRGQVRITDIYSERRRMEDLTNGEGEEAGVEADKPKGQSWLVGQLQIILKELQAGDETRGAGGAGGVKSCARVKPVRTPRSEFPLLKARQAELLRPEFCKGRLYFSCPCCRFPAALPVWLAGRKARCPRCYSAIRAPHPRKGLNARVLENDVESLLHPERFSRYYNAHKLIPWLGIPLPRLQTAVHAAGVAVLLTILTLFVPALLKGGAASAAKAIAAPAESWGERPYYKQRARELVEQFLAADSIAGKAALVRDTQRVTPLMEDWYGRRPGGGRVAPVAFEVSGVGFYANGLDYPVTDVHVELANGATAVYTVEHLPGGDCIEWESSVGYNADIPSLLESGTGADCRTMRVMAALDDYYNFNFADSGTHLCVRLHDPATLDIIGYGYAGQDEAGRAIAAQLSNSCSHLSPLTIEVRPSPDTAKTRQMEILRMLEPGWRTGERIASVTGI